MTDSPKCERCGSAEGRHTRSADAISGEAFISVPGDFDFQDHEALTYCDNCLPGWMGWIASQGFDLHTHGRSAPCDKTCISKGPGRFLQFATLQGLDRRSAFELAKAIDEQPRVNGSPLVWAFRIGHFQGGALARQSYYEAIANAEDLRSQLISTSQIPYGNVSPVLTDSHIVAVEIFDSAYSPRIGKFLHPAQGEKSRGLHAVAVEEFDETLGMFRFWNSWGHSWGDNGYGEMSFDYANDYFCDAIVMRYARWGPSPRKVKMWPSDANAKDFRRIWSIENPRSTRRVKGPNGRSWRVRRYESISPNNQLPVTCFSYVEFHITEIM